MVVIVIECPCYNKVEDKDEKMCGRVKIMRMMMKMMRVAMTKTKNWNYLEHPFLMGLQKSSGTNSETEDPHILCIHDENCLTPFLHQQNLLRLHATHMGVAV